MSQQNRTTLKGYFKTGARPTQKQFADLVDSSLNLAHNGIFDEGGNLGLGHSNPASTLSVKGGVTVSPNNDSAPGNGLFVHGNVGIGAGFTNPAAQLAVKGGVYIGNTETTDPGPNSLKVDGNIETGGNLSTRGNLSITGTLHARGDTTVDGTLTIGGAQHVATDEVRARGSGGLMLRNANGIDGLMIHDSGNVSIGIGAGQTDKFHVAGSLRVTSDVQVDGNLAASGNIQAGSLSLTGKIKTTGFLGHQEAQQGEQEAQQGEQGTGYESYDIDIPPNKVVVGLQVRRYINSENDQVLYSFALQYK